MRPRLVKKNSMYIDTKKINYLLTAAISKMFIITAPSNFTSDTLPDPDKFGCYNSYCKIERGWLTDETVVQFKLFNNPIKLWKNRLQNRKVHIKVRDLELLIS